MNTSNTSQISNRLNHANTSSNTSDVSTANIAANMSQIPSVLQRIVRTKIDEVAAAKQQLPLEKLIVACQKLDEPRRGFANALRAKRQANQLGIIAEIKKASPSKGIISHTFDTSTPPKVIAKGYETAGACCLSVLTDVEYFQGADEYLLQAREACHLPVLRKDFMIDAYQIYQSYLLGADCILLIMACLDDATVAELHQLSCELGMDVLIEVHTADELERALQLPASEHNIYGINNRDLNTFKVDLQHSIRLKDRLLSALADSSSANALVVSESGIHTAADVKLMQDNGIHAFLIGEQFMKTDDPKAQLTRLLTEVKQI